MRISPRRVGLVAAAVFAAGTVAAAPAMAKTLYVNGTSGSDTNSCTAKHKACATISGAVAKAKRGTLIRVASGTYAEQVTITKDIKLVGQGNPVIDATGNNNGILIQGRKASGASVKGFTIENALEEGILAMQTSRVKIVDNVVEYNDQGGQASSPQGECAPQGLVPGDCGEGLHLMTVSNSKVMHNQVKDNAGGILITDELGPTHNNVISFNRVTDNAYDCGITIPGHNTNAVSSTGKLQPKQGGVYRNVISHNTVNRNGLLGQGAGILIAGGAPGSAVYDNTVQDNTANDNGLGGFTLHSHAPNQDLNGNKVIGNTFQNDGQNGGNGQPGDSDFGITQTTGIIIASAVVHLKGIEVKGNRISDEYYGIWTQNAPAIKKSGNKFHNVTVDIHQQ